MTRAIVIACALLAAGCGSDTGAPVATPDSVTTAEDTQVDVPVLANDSDPDGDPLAVTGASA